jgi:hypothetical protein
LSADAAVAALVESLPEYVLRDLAHRLQPFLATPTTDHAGGWLDARAAADYLGLPSVDQIHKLTSSRTLTFSQERPGAKCYFKRCDLDSHREQHMRGGS